MVSFLDAPLGASEPYSQSELSAHLWAVEGAVCRLSVKAFAIHQSEELRAVGMFFFGCSAFVCSLPSNQKPLKRDTAKIRS